MFPPPPADAHRCKYGCVSVIVVGFDMGRAYCTLYGEVEGRVSGRGWDGVTYLHLVRKVMLFLKVRGAPVRGYTVRG